MFEAFEAYFDESGTDDKNEVMGVGGFIATREKWESFAVEWKAFLKSENIQRFHRVDLENFQKEFKEQNGWDVTRRDRVVKLAQTIIGKYLGSAYVHTLLKSDYDDIIHADPEARQKLGTNYYAFCGMSCISHIANWADMLGHNEAINYFFEAGAKGHGELDQIVRKAIKKKEWKAYFRCSGIHLVQKYDEVINGVVFPGIVQLHAADLLAYEGFKLADSMYAKNARPPRESMVHLQGQLQVNHIHHDAESFRSWIGFIRRGTVPYLT